MRAVSWLVWIGVVACAPKGPPAGAAPAVPTSSELTCPPGTVLSGVGPPEGTSMWCTKPFPDGTTQRHGPAMTWHANGQKASQGAYAMGKEEGPWLYWFPMGAPEKQGQFASGRREGVWTTFHPSGERASEGPLVDGKEHGRWMYWDANSQARSEGEFVLGQREGVWMDFGPDDRPIRERLYRNNRLVSQQEL